MTISSNPTSSVPLSSSGGTPLDPEIDFEDFLGLGSSFFVRNNMLDLNSVVATSGELALTVSGFALSSSLAMQSGLTLGQFTNLVSVMQMSAELDNNISGQVDVSSTMALQDAVRVTHLLAFVDTFTLGDTTDIRHLQAMMFASQFVLSDELTNNATFAKDFASALALRAVAAYGRPLDLVSTAEMVSVFESRYNAVLEAQSTMAMVGEQDIGQRVHMALFSTMEAGDSLDTNALLHIDLFDTAVASTTFQLGDDVYQGWVFATDSAAFTEYSNYPFNSIAMHRGVPYGASDDGIYRLEGDSDEGDAIEASIKTKLSSFRQRAIKNCKAVYVGKTSEGKLVLKVTTEKDGQYHEHWYQEKMGSHAGMHTGRFGPGRGLRSTYWQFEICNQNGDDFEIEDVTIMYEILSRRIRQ